MVAVVIPVRPGEDNPELVYTLRSIAAHVPDPDVWIVGYRPRWVHGVHWIPNHPTGEKSDRGCQQTRVAAHHAHLPREFWWWDDDMYRLTPLSGVEHCHGGPITAWLATFADVDSQYARALRRTAALRVADTALFWDLHVPYWVPDRHDLAETLDALPDGRGGWLWRTIHANHHPRVYDGPAIRDVKIYRDDPIPTRFGSWLSSDDGAFPRLEPLLRSWFPRMSPWEGEPTESTELMATYVRNGDIRTVPFRPVTDRTLIIYGWQRTALMPADSDAMV